MKARMFFLLLICLQCLIGFGQQGKGSSFRALSGPEKRWVLTHIFVAKQAQKASVLALHLSDSLRQAGMLDGDLSGGTLDAFRHSVWMALLCQQMNWHKAKRLGMAHEKGNYKPDKAAGDMDLHNNDMGLRIGRENKKNRIERVIELILWMIEDGQMKVISKDRFGKSLDAKGYLIPDDEWMGKWINRRCLVASDSLRK
jgi:hypothetical protein